MGRKIMHAFGLALGAAILAIMLLAAISGTATHPLGALLFVAACAAVLGIEWLRRRPASGR